MFFVHIKMNKVPRKSGKRSNFVLEKSENDSQNSVRTLYYYYYYAQLSYKEQVNKFTVVDSK